MLDPQAHNLELHPIFVVFIVIAALIGIAMYIRKRIDKHEKP